MPQIATHRCPAARRFLLLLPALFLGWGCSGGFSFGFVEAPPDEPAMLRGCTDPSADNFEQEAQQDDGSCRWACRSADIDHWETAIFDDDPWSYLAATSAPPANWNQLDFDNSAWPVGPGGIGYGDGDDGTQVPNGTRSVYLRRSFFVPAVGLVAGGLLHVDFDDGFVAYLNGVELGRANMHGSPPSWDSFATASSEARMINGGLPRMLRVPSALLRTGENVLALQVHNDDANSSDLSARAFLSLAMQPATWTFEQPPLWFDDVLLSSNLPIIVIDTGGLSVPDDPRILGQMAVIHCPNAERNSIADAPGDYEGQISIELRGSSFQSFPKKPYGLETQYADGSNRNVSLLGLPAENDWVFNNPYSDKSLMRNRLAYGLGEATGRYAPRTRYFELVINGSYEGLYLLTEKVKQGSNRVDVDKLTVDDIGGDELTGGYIVKVDKFTGSGGGGWPSLIDPEPTWDHPFFQFHEPSDVDVQPEQAAYIADQVNAFEAALWSPGATTPPQAYREFIDVDSFIDYLLIEELGRNVDAYRLSAFMHKDLDSNDGKLTMGPLWDFNLSFGNADYLDGWQIDGWAFNSACPFWWARFLEDPYFANRTRCRWEELRSGPLSDGELLTRIDTDAELIAEAADRNFDRWPILGTYVWPNWYVADSWEEELDFMSDWTLDRALWLDQNLPGACGD